jgi:hypothetical protein
MGFFSKIFKGVKKVFKKIGKGIKSAFKSVGKFMGKLGIIGQIGLGLLLPGLGSMLGNFAGTLMSSSSVIAQGAGHFINAAVNVGTKIGSTFKTITEGVSSVIGETVGAVANKIPGMDSLVSSISGGKIDISSKNFGTVFDTASSAITDVAKAGRNLFSMDTLTGTNKFYIEKQIGEAIKATDVSKAFKEGTLELADPLTMEQKIKQSFSGEAIDFSDPNWADKFKVEPGQAFENFTVDLPSETVVPSASAPSLLERDVKTAKSLPEEAFQRGKEAVVSAPERFIDTAVMSAGQKAVGAIPDQNITSFNAAIPTIDFSGGQIYASSAPAVDPFEYTRSVESGMGYVGNMGRQYDVYKSYMGIG